ncbi:MAG: iron-sulfur cluster assembly scaffold protein [uncultured DHVE6 group euryarchaeote]|jgi:NifU-like protein involved in Fe-S cluster formation/bacterioferritin-associated ferredoxin|nr:MAG: iron-sulfur cluster assembly scaffold protein [uncultured DHVE6 group euryarchaeote]
MIDVKAAVHPDVKAKVDAKSWFYTDEVRDHFFNPKNILKTQKEASDYDAVSDGVGEVGSPACGDMMKIWIKVDSDSDKIKECKWQTFGCASAIASTSIMSEMVIENGGMTITQALELKPHDIVERLHGLPARKFHCSVLGDKALRAAINNYFFKSDQKDRMIISKGAEIVDKILKITDKDIEEAVLEGAHDFEAVQKKTKVGVQDKTCIPRVNELIEFYKDKYYG